MVYLDLDNVSTWWSNCSCNDSLVYKRFNRKLIHGQKEVKVINGTSGVSPYTTGLPVWPEYWKIDELEKVEATLQLQNGMHNGCNLQQQKRVTKNESGRFTTKTSCYRIYYSIIRYSFLKKETADFCDNHRAMLREMKTKCI